MGWFSKRKERARAQDLVDADLSDAHVGGLVRGVHVQGGTVAHAAEQVRHIGPVGQDHLPSTEITRISTDVGILTRRFDEFVGTMHGLNTALGEFRDRQVEPIKAELRHLRYNLGSKVEQTTTQLDSVVNHLDRQINVFLKLQGKSDDEIRKFKIEAGIAPDAPTGPELEAQAALIDGLKEELFHANEQVKRLLEQVTTLNSQVQALTVGDALDRNPKPEPKKGKRRGR